MCCFCFILWEQVLRHHCRSTLLTLPSSDENANQCTTCKSNCNVSVIIKLLIVLKKATVGAVGNLCNWCMPDHSVTPVTPWKERYQLFCLSPCELSHYFLLIISLKQKFFHITHLQTCCGWLLVCGDWHKFHTFQRKLSSSSDKKIRDQASLLRSIQNPNRTVLRWHTGSSTLASTSLFC